MSTATDRAENMAHTLSTSEAALRGGKLGCLAGLVYGLGLFLLTLVSIAMRGDTQFLVLLLFLPIYLVLVMIIGCLPATLVGWISGGALAKVLNHLRPQSDVSAGLAGVGLATLMLLLLNVAGTYIGLRPGDPFHIIFLGCPSLIYVGLSIYTAITFNRER